MKTIIVVEEDDSSRNLLWELLTQRKNHKVHLHKDETTLLPGLDSMENEPDLLVIDIDHIARKDDSFFTEFRRRFPKTDIIAFSKKPDNELIKTALDRGVSFVLSYPVDINGFMEKVDRIMNRRRTRTAIAADVRPDFVKEDWLELTAPSDMEFIERFRHFTELLYQTTLSDDLKRDLKIAINELGQNAIEWGNRGDSEKKVHLLYCMFDDRIMLKVEDEGEGFDLDKLEDPTREPLSYQRKRESQGKRVGGYGIYIVKSLMDRVIYNRKGNIVIMTKFLPSSPPPESGGE